MNKKSKEGAEKKGDSTGRLIVIRPFCEEQERSARMSDVLDPVLARLEDSGVEIVQIIRIAELDAISMKGQTVLFAVCLSAAGVNMEYYRLLEYFRENPDCLQDAVGGIMVDGGSELFTKALARRLAFSANMAGCTLPGNSLVEATGSLGNFHVLSKVRGVDQMEVYRQQTAALVHRLLEFRTVSSGCDGKKLSILAVHASSRKTSNTLLLWDMVKEHLSQESSIREISLRDGSLRDCIGCRYEDCLHFGEIGKCFYGGIITEQVYPAIIDCDVLVMICPNYNDALGANFTAFINRLTALFRVHDFSRKRVYALIISGYSGGDIVSEQIIGALCFNKGFILPGRFAMVETANDPMSILEVPDIRTKAECFAGSIMESISG